MKGEGYMEKPALILLAEHSSIQSERFCRLFEDAGYRVNSVTDGLAALDFIRNHSVDLVVTDLNMPEMNGLDLVTAAKEMAPDVPIILTTIEGDAEIAVQALQLGAATYISKNHLEQNMLDTIERVLAVAAVTRDSHGIINFVTGNEVEYELLNDSALVPALIGKVQNQISEMGLCDASELMQLGTALDEALVNAIIHGNLEVPSELREVEDGRSYLALTNERRHLRPFSDRKVYVKARTTRNEAVVVIRDEGPGFDPGKIPDPTDLSNLERVSGRGLFLINAFMDQVIHENNGTQITMIKRKSPAPTTD